MEPAAGGADALEQFLILAKTAKGPACVALIQQVLNHPKVYVFGELLQMPNVLALKESEHAGQLTLLEIFAYGTYGDSKRSGLPEITDAQCAKLRKLTLLHLAQRESRLGYNALLAALEMANVRELEDLVIEAIYAGMLEAKLDQRDRVVRIHRRMARDVRGEEVAAVAAKLQAWNAHTGEVLQALMALQATARAESVDAQSQAEDQTKRQRDLLREVKRRIAAITGDDDPTEMEMENRARFGGRSWRRAEQTPERFRHT